MAEEVSAIIHSSRIHSRLIAPHMWLVLSSETIPPPKHVRSALREELDAIMDVIEANRTVPPERLWQFFAAVSGGMLAARIHDEALGTVRKYGFDPGGEDTELLGRKYHQAALFHLVLEAAPVLPGNFNAGAVANDLLAMLKDSGAPQILQSQSRNNAPTIKEPARRLFVLGVIYRAQREGIAADKFVRDRLGLGMTRDAWQKWCKPVQIEARERARKAAASGDDWTTSTDDASLTTYFQIGFGQALIR